MQILRRSVLSGVLIMACVCWTFAQSQTSEQSPAATETKATASDAKSLPTGWQRFTFGAKGIFTIAMPKAPVSSSEDLSSDDVKVKADYHNAQGDEIFIVIADMHDMSMAVDNLDEETRNFFFEKFRDGLVEGITSEAKKSNLKFDIQFSTQRNVEFKGISGVEQELSVGTFKRRTRMLPLKGHVVIFFALVMPGSDASLVGTLLDSFEYVDK